MSLLESIIAAFRSVLSNRLRAFLTMLGIIIGISSVITITSVGSGFQSMINAQLESFGLDTIQLYLSGRGTIESSDRITYSDVDLINKYKDVAAATAISSMSYSDAVELKNPNETRSIDLNGVSEQYFAIKTIKLLYGRALTKQDIEFENNVIVIDELFAEQVFGIKEVVGKQLTAKLWYGEEIFTIVGVTEADRNTEYQIRYNRPAMVIMPITAFKTMIGGYEMVNYVLIKAADTSKTKVISDGIIRLMEITHNNKDKYEAWAVADEANQANQIITMFTAFLGFVAAISLLVGGIGVMNIMLVSVTERTREIGIRKSLGATNINIQFQFLVEAIILTAIGGVIGIMLGYLLSLGLGALLVGFINAQGGMSGHFSPGFSLGMILLVTAISSTIGIIFGVYPAAKAAKMNVVDALRFE